MIEVIDATFAPDTSSDAVVFPNTMIRIDGIICAGKTTLLNASKAKLNSNGIKTKVLYESPNPVMLDLFYTDMRQYAFCMQMHMLQQRQRMHDTATAYKGTHKEYTSHKKGARVWLDRTLWGDMAFILLNYESGNISDKELDAYQSVMKNITRYAYDTIVFLDVSAQRSHYVNLKLCGKTSEKNIPLLYLKDLRRMYFIVLDKISKLQTIKLVLLSNDPFIKADSVREEIAKA